MTTLDACEKAMLSDTVSDRLLIRMFRLCDNPVQLVWRAIETNERGVRLLLAEKFDFNFVDIHGCNALRHAYCWASQSIVDMLIEAGVRDDSGDAWHYAAHNRDEKLMSHLIGKGIDVNAADTDGFTLAHRAAGNGNLKVLSMRCCWRQYQCC